MLFNAGSLFNIQVNLPYGPQLFKFDCEIILEFIPGTNQY